MTKSEYKVLYRYQTCPFVPTKDVPFEEMPDVVEGTVLFVEEGEYNPSGWYKPLVVKKVICCLFVMRDTHFVIIVRWK